MISEFKNMTDQAKYELILPKNNRTQEEGHIYR